MHWNVPIDCKHIYSDSSTRTITITGNVTYFNCSDNQLTSLDVSNNTTLKALDCSGNQLTSLDVSNNTVMKVLSCFNNQLISLNVSNNTILKLLGCEDNQLTSLNVGENPALELLNCSNNQLKSDALNALFGSLHNNKIERGKEFIFSNIYGFRNMPIGTFPGSIPDGKSMRVKGNPGVNSCDRSIAENKGWRVSVPQ